MKVVETGEIKEVGLATFKRWWKPVKEETEPETTATEQTETQDAPTESQEAQNEPEAPQAEEMPTETQEAPADDQGDEDKPLALSEIVSKLESLFDMLNGLYFEGKLPRPIITVQSTPKFYGHCSTTKTLRRAKTGSRKTPRNKRTKASPRSSILRLNPAEGKSKRPSGRARYGTSGAC